MNNKSKRGGPDRGQGRKPRDPKYGARVKANFTLRPDQYKAIVGKDVAAYIDQGLSITIPSLGHAPGTEACLIAYHAVSEAIIRLERIRDINPETHMDDDGTYWTPEQERLHKLLNEFWDRLRAEPTFWEPEMPE